MNHFIEKNGNLLDAGGLIELEQKQGKQYSPAKAAFVRQASHDLRGTFFGLAGLCAMIAEAKDKEENVELLVDHLMEACHTYKFKLNNFLEYIRFDAGMVDTLLEPIGIRKLLERVIQENRYAASEKKVEIMLEVGRDLPELITTDEFRLAQVCTNLLSNAINFSPAGSEVMVRVRKEGNDSWALVIEDKGEGMTEKELKSVFRILAIDRIALKNPGGLGLLVTRYLVEEILKGEITLKADRGTRITVILPLAGEIEDIKVKLKS
jgi:two-component system, NarL family, sensor histidine kinase BarA